MTSLPWELAVASILEIPENLIFAFCTCEDRELSAIRSYLKKTRKHSWTAANFKTMTAMILPSLIVSDNDSILGSSLLMFMCG